MKLATTLASAIALAALIAFSAHPSRAEDGAGTPPPGPRGERRGPGRRPPPGRGHGHGAVMAADANRDGAVSAKEWQDFLMKIQNDFTQMDKDGDGAISREEMPAGPRQRGDGAGRGRGPDGAEGRRRGPRGGGGGPDSQPGPSGRRGFGPPEGRGPEGRRGPPEGRGPRGPGGPAEQGPDGRPGGGPDAGQPSDGPRESVADLRARIDRLTALVEKLLAERKAGDK